MAQRAGVKQWMNEHQNLVQMVLPGLVILILVMVLIVPKVREWRALQERMKRLGKEMEQVSQELETLSPERIRMLDARDAEDRKMLPERDGFYTYLENLKEVGRSLGIDEISYFRGAVEQINMEEVLTRSSLGALPVPIDTDSHVLYGIPVKIQFRCAYRTLYHFLKSLREGKRLIDIREVRLKKTSNGLSVEMKMELYYFTDPGEKPDAA